MIRRLAIVCVLALGLGVLTTPTTTAVEGAGSYGPEAVLKGMERMQQGVAMTQRSLIVAPQVGWNAGLEDMRPISAPWYRIWDMKSAWRDVNPAPGVFDWSILDRRIAQVESWGGRPLLVLGLTPQWAALDPQAGDPRWGAGSSSIPADLQAWSTYVRAVTTRYGDRIGAYEIWNEANLKTFWSGSAADMVEMAGVAYQLIKTYSPNAIVLAPSVTTRLKSGARFTTEFIKALPARKDRDYADVPFDAWTIHTYPAGNAGVSFDGNCNADPSTGQTPQDCVDGKSPLLAASQRATDVRQWQQAVVETVGPDSPLLDKEIWDTEVNYGLAGPGIVPGVDWTQQQGVSLINYTLADSAALGIDNTFWYQFTATPYSLLGIQMTPGSRTASAYSRFAADPRRNERTSSIDFRLPFYAGCQYRYILSCNGADLKNANLSDSRMARSGLSGADLYRANLSGSSLRFSDLRNARLFEANISEMDARRARFTNANMKRVTGVEADFRNAFLQNADFRGADLRGADFRSADLRGADFRGADLRGADLRTGTAVDANFKRAKTREALGLR